MTNLRMRAGGASHSNSPQGQKCWQMPLFFVELFSHPAFLVQEGTKSLLSINLTNTICPTLVIL